MLEYYILPATYSNSRTYVYVGGLVCICGKSSPKKIHKRTYGAGMLALVSVINTGRNLIILPVARGVTDWAETASYQARWLL